MNRLRHTLLLLTIACGGGSTGPATVATVTLTPALSALRVGETATITAAPKDAGGHVLTGRTTTWNSSNTSVASVTAAGVVTGVSAGSVIITATVDAKSGQLPITVIAGGPDCAAANPLSIGVGEVRVLANADRATLCVPGGASGAEYALIAVNTTVPRQASSLSILSINTLAPAGTPLTASARAAAPSVNPRAITGLSTIAGSMPRDLAFESNLRAIWRAERRALRRTPGSAASVRRAAGATASIRNLPSTPGIGTLVELNASSTSACEVPLRRTGRVAAVSNTAIVIEDTTAPPGGFTNAEYLSIATTFDTLIFPFDTTLFGAPYDMDGNGRVVLFFTTAVNQRTAPGATSLIGGFFWERDLIPRTPTAIVPFSCANSNEGEMFYLPVVDVGSRYNSFFTNKTALLADINASTVHEFQHLINSSTRIYITPEIVEEEEAWLNEGMSHIAEELLYLRVTGLQPRTDINFSQSTSPASRLDFLNTYQVDNLSRFNSYLVATEGASAYAAAEDLPTRGAAWVLLRWALDHSSGPAEPYLRALVRAPTQGIPNFDNVFAGVGGLVAAVRQSSVAHFTDNLTTTMAPGYSHLSWNFRDWMPHFVSNSGRFPLNSRSLVGGIPLNVSLVAGGTSYIRFRVNANVTGGVSVAVAGAAPAASTELVLVRVN
jgi:hypothetical protein